MLTRFCGHTTWNQCEVLFAITKELTRYRESICGIGMGKHRVSNGVLVGAKLNILLARSRVCSFVPIFWFFVSRQRLKEVYLVSCIPLPLDTSFVICFRHNPSGGVLCTLYLVPCILYLVPCTAAYVFRPCLPFVRTLRRSTAPPFRPSHRGTSILTLGGRALL